MSPDPLLLGIQQYMVNDDVERYMKNLPIVWA